VAWLAVARTWTTQSRARAVPTSVARSVTPLSLSRIGRRASGIPVFRVGPGRAVKPGSIDAEGARLMRGETAAARGRSGRGLLLSCRRGCSGSGGSGLAPEPDDLHVESEQRLDSSRSARRMRQCLAEARSPWTVDIALTKAVVRVAVRLIRDSRAGDAAFTEALTTVFSQARELSAWFHMGRLRP
jgi:hypothetical protein